MASLEAKRSRTSAGRADEGQAVGADHVGEALVLGQEAVAGMDGVAAGDDRGRDDGRRREVAALGVGGADADGLVGELRGEALAIGLAVGDDGADAEGPAGAQDPQGDLAAVGDQDLVEHQAFPVAARRGSRSRTGRRRGGGEPRAARSDQLLAVLDGLAGLDQARRRRCPSTGATTSWWTPRTSTWPILSPARTRMPDRQVLARVEDADRRRRGRDGSAGRTLVGLADAAAPRGRARTPGGRVAGVRRPAVLAVAAAPRPRPACAGGPSSSPSRTSISPRPLAASLAISAGSSSSASRPMASWSRLDSGAPPRPRSGPAAPSRASRHRYSSSRPGRAASPDPGMSAATDGRRVADAAVPRCPVSPGGTAGCSATV